MKKENLDNEISNSVQALLKLAREKSFNTISDNCKYILSEIIPSDKSSFEQNTIRKILNDKKEPLSFPEIIRQVEVLYSDLYDINIYIYKARKNLTIVEIQYFSRSTLDKEYQKQLSSYETMLHCKIDLPPYASNNEIRFDINWQLGTFHHKWNMFWWKIKIKINI